jgi:UbiD family decarboxylase
VEGPFGDHFGHYSGAAPFPVFHLRRVTRRRNPVYPAAVVGKPPQEDRYLGDAAQEMLAPLIKVIHPELRDLWAYYEAGFHNLLVASVEVRFTKEAMKTALGLLGQGQLALTKVVVLVGPDVNVRDFQAVLRAIQQHFYPGEDFALIPEHKDTLTSPACECTTGGDDPDATLKADISRPRCPGADERRPAAVCRRCVPGVWWPMPRRAVEGDGKCISQLLGWRPGGGMAAGVT